eukprot:TRINITY_DN9822_c0_g1_i1.p3 TRINITY_DN9822_c0_g1~~TRINITY_DN9822_c0_g1_i1.p3  ORF type:complete len:131 (-),score=20.16 TRINITY_DN9822_c0_g1_i1:162-554(-)
MGWSTCLGENDVVCVNINYGFGSIKLAVMTCLAYGGKVVFFGNSFEKTFDIMREVNPTFAIFPPIFLHKSYPAILEKMNTLPPAAKEGLEKCIISKIEYMKSAKQVSHPELDKHLAAFKTQLFGLSLIHI